MDSQWSSLPDDLAWLIFVRLIELCQTDAAAHTNICSARLVCFSWSQQMAMCIHSLQPGPGPVPRHWASQFRNVRKIDLSKVRRHVIGELNPVQWALEALLQAPHNLRSSRKRGRGPAEWCSVGHRGAYQKQLKQLSGLQQVKASGIHFSRSGIRNISRLSQLTHIDFSRSNIPDLGMEELRNLRHLLALNLENCDNVQPPTMQATLKSFSSLTYLNLSGCNRSVNNLLIPALTCSGLTSLSLKYCTKLTWHGLQHLKRFSKLEALDLSQIPELDNSMSKVLAKLPRLRSLDLSWATKFTDDGLADLRGLSKLSHLDISFCNRVTDSGIQDLCRWDPCDPDRAPLEHLEYLDLTWCQVTSLGMDHLKAVTGLKTLKLANCQTINDRACITLSEFTTLTNLDLASCFLVSDLGLRALSALPNLRSLDLKRIHRITDEGLHALTHLPMLEHVDLRCDVQISDEGVAALRALPQLKSIDLRLCSKVSKEELARWGKRAVRICEDKSLLRPLQMLTGSMTAALRPGPPALVDGAFAQPHAVM